MTNSPDQNQPTIYEIPKNTPIPLENFRWANPHKLTIYLNTDNNEAKQAYQQAIHDWNNTHLVTLTLTNDSAHADISANIADYSAQTKHTNNTIIETLGLTKTNYDTTTHQSQHANCAIDIQQLHQYSPQERAWVAEHELGHALGLWHAKPGTNSIMVPANQKGGITNLDTDSLKALYQE